MFCINLNTSDPFFNLAVEEYLLKNSKEEYLLLGVNNPSVIIGKHQAGHREADTRFVNENHIPVIRRISGGGTVYHDNGNLNFSFISQSEIGKQVDFRKYTQPVIDFLLSFGIEAKFEGKNDLKVGGYKISGNAEHIHRNRVLHHGTLLFSTSMEMLHNSIRKDTSCYTSRAVASNPASVMNLNEKMNCFQNINEFRSEMLNYFLKRYNDFIPYELTPSETENAEALAGTKYKQWEWNWAYGPEYKFINRFQLSGEYHTCSLFVKDGIIMECQLEGSKQMNNFSKNLPGRRHMPDDLYEVFAKENVFFDENEIYNFF